MGGLDGDFSCVDCGIADEAFCGVFCEEFCGKLYPNYLCNFCLNEMKLSWFCSMLSGSMKSNVILFNVIWFCNE